MFARRGCHPCDQVGALAPAGLAVGPASPIAAPAQKLNVARLPAITLPVWALAREQCAHPPDQLAPRPMGLPFGEYFDELCPHPGRPAIVVNHTAR